MSHPCSLTRPLEKFLLLVGARPKRAIAFGLALVIALLTADKAIGQIDLSAASHSGTAVPRAGSGLPVGHAPANRVHTFAVGHSAIVEVAPNSDAVSDVSSQDYDEGRQVRPASVDSAEDLDSGPGMPENFRITVSGSVASLEWEPPSTGGAPSDYLLTLGTAQGLENLLSEYPIGNVLTLSGPLQQPGTYYARIRASNLMGVGPSTPEVMFRTEVGAPPQAPINLAAAWLGSTVNLTWLPSPGASSYVLEAGSISRASDFGTFGMGAATAFSTAVPPGTYFVRVRALNAHGSSAPSNELSLQVAGPGVPGQPQDLTASISGDLVTLRWNPPPNGPTPTGYTLEVGTALGSTNLGTFNVGNVTTLTAPAPPGTYYVRVRAVNALGTGNPSAEIVVRL